MSSTGGLPPKAREAIVEVTERLRRAGIEEARREAEILVRGAARLTREELALHPGRELTETELSRLEGNCRRREEREPLPYILGEVEFHSFTLFIDKNALIPRPETELLGEAILARMGGEARLGADVGTGAGALAVMLAKESPQVRVIATDISRGALALAKRNIERHGVSARVFPVCCDLLGGVREPLDFIAANPPYIRRDEFEGLAPEVRDYEPRLALDGGMDGLGLIRRLCGQLRSNLRAGGFAVLEVGAGQEEEAAKLVMAGGLSDIETLPDYAGLGRIVIGWRKGW